MTHVDHRDLLARAADDLAAARKIAPRAHECVWSPLRSVPICREAPPLHAGEYGGVRRSFAPGDDKMPLRHDKDAAKWWDRAVVSLNDLHQALVKLDAGHSPIVLGGSRGSVPLGSVLGSVERATWRLTILARVGDLGADGPVVDVADASHDVLLRLRKSAGPDPMRLCIWSVGNQPCAKVLPDDENWPHAWCRGHVCKVCHEKPRKHGDACWRCTKRQTRDGTTAQVRCRQCYREQAA